MGGFAGSSRNERRMVHERGKTKEKGKRVNKRMNLCRAAPRRCRDKSREILSKKLRARLFAGFLDASFIRTESAVPNMKKYQ